MTQISNAMKERWAERDELLDSAPFDDNDPVLEWLIKAVCFLLRQVQ